MELLVALVLTSVVAAAGITALLSTLKATARLQHHQVASRVLDQALQVVRIIDARPDAQGCVKILQGRTQADTLAHWASAPVELSGMTPAWNPAGCPASPVVLPPRGLPVAAGTPPTDPVTVGAIAYTVQSFVGSCTLTTDACVLPTLTTSTRPALRVVVSVSWPGPGCPPPSCTLSATTLVDPGKEPVFNISSVAAPFAAADAVCVARDTQTAINVVANDLGHLGATPVKLTRSPGHGTIDRLEAGIGTYTPATGYVGADRFSYQLSDANGALSDVVDVLITVGNGC